MTPYMPLSHMGTKWPSDPATSYATRNPRQWLSPDTKLFAIGSCFAVNFGRWITRHGVDIISPEWGLHYNSTTIREELCEAAGEVRPHVTWSAPGKDGRTTFYDAKRHPISAGTAEELDDVRSRIAAAGRRGFRDADAFLITLGLSEVWEQFTDNGWQVLNRAPLSALRDSTHHRFRNRFQSCREIEDDLHRIVAAVNEVPGPKRPVVFTISPVPLKTTGADYDPRIANTRSKSILVTALHAFMDGIDPALRGQISYFPAYEMFQYYQESEQIWQGDGRHILPEKIDRVCRSFAEIFAETPDRFGSLPDFEVPRT